MHLIDDKVEAKMVATVEHWIDLATDLLRSESSRRFIRARLKTLVQGGTIPVMRVAAWANGGLVDAHQVLCETAAELLDRGEPVPSILASYTAHALLNGASGARSARGEVASDNLLRDLVVACMVGVVCQEWPFLKATRNRASQVPSAASIVSQALLL